MTKVDEVIKEMGKGTPLESIRKKCKGQSQLYEAFSRFMPEAEQKIREKQNELSSLTSQLRALEDQIDLLKTQANELEEQKTKREKTHAEWFDEAEKRKKQLQRELSELQTATEEKHKKLDLVKSEISKLAERGITLELLTRVNNIEPESGNRLLEMVKTAADYSVVKKELAELGEGKKSFQEEIGRLEKGKDDVIKKTRTQENILDELMLKTRNFHEAISIIHYFFGNGYNTEDLKRLKEGLDSLGVKSDPTLSIERLIRGLENVKTLTGLVEEIKKSRGELETLQANIAEAKGELKALRDTVIKAIDEAKEKVVSQILSVNNATAIKIKETAENSIAKTDETCRNNINQVKNAGETAVSIIKNLRDNTEKTLKSLNKQAETTFTEASKTSTEIVQTIETETEKALNRFNDHVSTATAKFKQDYEEWGNIRERVGEYKQTLEYAVLLFGILETPEALRKVPSSIVKRLMRRIYVWTSMMLPNETMKPSENMHDKEWNLSTFTSYKLPVVFEWCTEELEKRFRKEA